MLHKDVESGVVHLENFGTTVKYRDNGREKAILRANFFVSDTTLQQNSFAAANWPKI